MCGLEERMGTHAEGQTNRWEVNVWGTRDKWMVGVAQRTAVRRWGKVTAGSVAVGYWGSRPIRVAGGGETGRVAI